MYKQAVCIARPVVPSWQTVIAISRRNDTSLWGLPGGKVDPGETKEQAICREVQEELGVSLSDAELVPIYTGYDGEFEVTTYVVKDQSYVVDISTLVPEPGLVLAAMSQHQLCDPQNTPWPEYNTSVIRAVNEFRRQL